MKKSLSLLLAIAMVFSMFAAVASANEELTTQQKFDVLFEAGIFEGYPPNNDPGLNREMTRAEFSKILALVTEAPSNPAANTYTDVPATHWAAEFIGAVTAAGLMEGVGLNRFDPNGRVTIEQVAATLVRALGLGEASGDLTGTFSPWAQGYILAAQEANLPITGPNYKANALRTVLVDNAYAVYTFSNVTVTNSVVVDEKNVTVTFSDGETQNVVLDTALVEGQATTIKVTHKGVEYDVVVTLGVLGATATATGASTVEVKLNRSINPANATFTVAKGTANVTVSNKAVAEDNMTATLTLGSKLTAGEYTVTVAGVSTAPITATFTAENERIEEIAFNSDRLALVDNTGAQVTTTFKVTNQYGEDITSTYGGQVTFNASKSTGTVNNNNGRLTITAPGTTSFVINEPVLVSGIHTNSGKTVSATLTVGPQAIVDTITVKELYHPEGKTISAGANFTEFVLLIEALDQYGNKVNAARVNEDVFINVTNPSIFQIATTAQDNQGRNRDQVGIRLAAPVGNTAFEGTNTITFITKMTAKTTRFDVEVGRGTALQSLSLQQPAELVAANDGTVRIPFTAVDGLGNAVTKFSDLNGKVTLTSSNDVGNDKAAALYEDYATGNAYIEWEVPSVQGNYSITALTQGTGTFQPSNVIINVQPEARPVTVQDTTGIALSQQALAAPGRTFTFKGENILVRDQHGREYKANAAKVFDKDFYLELRNLDGTVIGTIASEAGSVPITLIGADSRTIEIHLLNPDDTSISSKRVEVRAVASNELRNFAVADIPKLYNGGADHGKKITVTATQLDGTRVELDPANYTVQTPPGLVFADNKVYASGVTFNNNQTERTFTITVLITANNATPITKQVVVSNEAPVQQSHTLGNDGNLTISNGSVTGPANQITLAAVLNTIKFKDQYGTETKADPATTVFSITNATGAQFSANVGTVAGTTTTSMSAGNRFTVTFTEETGRSVTVTVVAGAPTTP